MIRFTQILPVFVLIQIVACGTLAKPPEIRTATIQPAELGPGDTAIITIQISDKYGIVAGVEGIIQEDPSIQFKLKDDGIAPDEEAADGIWTLQVDVPFNAPPGDFQMDVTAYNANGEPIVVRNDQGEAVPLTTRFPIVIRFAEQP